MPIDIERSYKHQAIFKLNVDVEGGWKVRLYQNSGDPVSATVNMKVIGPILF